MTKKYKRPKTVALKSIKIKFIAAIIPVVTCLLVLLALNTYKQAKEIIINYAHEIVESSVNANKHQVEGWIENTYTGLNQVQNTLNTVDMDQDALLAYLTSTMNQNESYPRGVYIGTSNQELYDPAGWVPPADYVVTERPWFIEGLENEKFKFSSVYIDENTGEHIVSASVRIKSEQGINRVAATDVSLGAIEQMISAKKMMNTGNILLVDTESELVLATNDNRISSISFSDIISDINLDSTEIVESKSGNMTYSLGVQSINNTPWKIIGYVSHTEILKDLETLRQEVTVIFVAVMILLIIVIERVVHIIIRPIKKLNGAIQEITEGNFTVHIDAKGNDEVAVMSRSLETFIETMRTTIQEVRGFSDKLKEQSNNSDRVAEELYKSADTQARAMDELNHTVEELAKSVLEVAGNTTSLSIMASETGDKGQEASIKMQDTVLVSEQGKSDMYQINQSMENIELTVEQLKMAVKQVDESSEKISDIGNMIGYIANQTNLLALNAAIEAARAGEAGRGFAVVAEEIRKLAVDSQSSVDSIASLTGDIKRLVSDTIVKTQESSDSIKESRGLIHSTGETFEKIYMTINEANDIVQEMITKVNTVDEVAASVATFTEEQSAASEEIFATSECLASSAKKVTENSHVVEEDAHELAKTAEGLNKHMNMFKI